MGTEFIKIPKENVSDDKVLLVELTVKSGSKVKKDETVALLETSKSVFDIVSPAEGYLFYQCKTGDQIAVGEVFAVISDKEDFFFESFNIDTQINTDGSDKVKFSKKAIKLIKEKKLDKNIFTGMVTEEDVLNYLNERKTEHKTGDKSNKILILGAGGWGKMCIDILRQMKIFEISGLIDDGEHIPIGSRVMEVPVIGRHRDLKSLYEEGYRFIINGVGAITNHTLREKLYIMLKEIGFYVPNIIHPGASIEPSVILGEGNQIMANSTIGSDARIGNNCIINSNSVVSHDCILSDNVHLSPGAILAGGVKVGKNTLIGMGSAVYINLTIGENVRIYNKSNITKNVPDNSIVKDTIQETGLRNFRNYSDS